jgi:hypothetical protein
LFFFVENRKEEYSNSFVSEKGSKMLFEKLFSPILQVAEYIYFNGPSRFGFWNGIAKEEACAELTRVPSTVWIRQYDACSELLSKDFRAFCIGAGLVSGAVILWKSLDALIWTCTVKNFFREKAKQV